MNIIIIINKYYKGFRRSIYSTGYLKNGDANTMNFMILAKFEYIYSLNSHWLSDSTSLKSTKFHQENMQCHTEYISFGIFFNLDISGMPHLSELIFWIYMSNTNITSISEAIMKLFL